jgi:ABC-type bacteriocin/lantibiotic exporter with double-glycine peptidase domain
VRARALNAEQHLGMLTQSLLVVPGFLTMLNTVVVLAVGGFLVIGGHLSLPALIAFQMLAASFFAPITQVVAVASQFQDARAWMQQIDDVLRQPADRAAPDVPLAITAGAAVGPDRAPGEPDRAATASNGHGRRPLRAGTARKPRLQGHLELRGVTFGHVPTEPPLIAGLSVTLRPGERVALVGPTGSGKSTVANLVTGLFQPWSGEILFDGLPRGEIAPEVMAASLAKVDQSILLFSGTVADNIRFWDQSIPAREVIRAAEDACVADDIQAKPGGFGHHVSEGGRDFSGGQRQRLEIARALAVNPAVLVLDEATSARDAVTEQAVDTSLRRRGCTCLIIAHRLSTIRDCDQIIVLDRGEVAQQGTHEELVDAGGLYRDLVSQG